MTLVGVRDTGKRQQAGAQSSVGANCTSSHWTLGTQLILRAGVQTSVGANIFSAKFNAPIHSCSDLHLPLLIMQRNPKCEELFQY